MPILGLFETGNFAVVPGVATSNPGHLSAQELLPESVVGARFYEPDEAEDELAARLQRIRGARGSQAR